MAQSESYLSYEWLLGSEMCSFYVDTSFDEPAAGYETLIYAALRTKSAEQFTKAELSELKRLEKKLKKALSSAIYLGYIHTSSLRQYYFYTKSETESLEALKTLKDKTTRLELTFGSAHEPDWLTYHSLLLPDEAKYQTVLNKEILLRLSKAGDNASTVRRLTLTMCFKSDQLRLLFAEKARKHGFALGEPKFRPELNMAHTMSIHCLSALSKPEIDAITTKAIYLAEAFEGELLRWTSPLMPKRNPLS